MSLKTESSKKTTTKDKDYWWCECCEISSDHGSRMIPCPRGGCEAELRGEYKITTIKEFNPIESKPKIDDLLEGGINTPTFKCGEDGSSSCEELI